MYEFLHLRNFLFPSGLYVVKHILPSRCSIQSSYHLSPSKHTLCYNVLPYSASCSRYFYIRSINNVYCEAPHCGGAVFTNILLLTVLCLRSSPKIFVIKSNVFLISVSQQLFHITLIQLLVLLLRLLFIIHYPQFQMHLVPQFVGNIVCDVYHAYTKMNKKETNFHAWLHTVLKKNA